MHNKCTLFGFCRRLCFCKVVLNAGISADPDKVSSFNLTLILRKRVQFGSDVQLDKKVLFTTSF
eukprot:3519126-Amphidinium_carterae.1